VVSGVVDGDVVCGAVVAGDEADAVAACVFNGDGSDGGVGDFGEEDAVLDAGVLRVGSVDGESFNSEVSITGGLVGVGEDVSGHGFIGFNDAEVLDADEGGVGGHGDGFIRDDGGGGQVGDAGVVEGFLEVLPGRWPGFAVAVPDECWVVGLLRGCRGCAKDCSKRDEGHHEAESKGGEFDLCSDHG